MILDEAQAIKNADSQAAKAARLLKGRHRLAMSGTPIENHLGELWSIFEFLNPGMLGTATVFKKHAGGASAPDEAARSHALPAPSSRSSSAAPRPQVVKDLPEKTEQTLYCDMEPAQRKVYDDLREHYRGALLAARPRRRPRRSKIEVLEALLRLRQAACHPGLIDPDRASEPAAKLDMLLPAARRGRRGGPQGPGLLAVHQLPGDRPRAARRRRGSPTNTSTARPATAPSASSGSRPTRRCPVFLISLKAGGLGLNLTAAEYVYLLDPWWNPAVEAQAIDRSHRIGQTRSVFAYRLICRDTVEEKILELQQKKRDLADAILNADNRMLPNLTRDDLEFLLS